MPSGEAACESGPHMLMRCLFLCPVQAGLGISGCPAIVPWGLWCLHLVWFSPPSAATHSVMGLVEK